MYAFKKRVIAFQDKKVISDALKGGEEIYIWLKKDEFWSEPIKVELKKDLKYY